MRKEEISTSMMSWETGIVMKKVMSLWFKTNKEMKWTDKADLQTTVVILSIPKRAMLLKELLANAYKCSHLKTLMTEENFLHHSV